MASVSLPNPTLRHGAVRVSAGTIGAAAAGLLVWVGVRVATAATASPRYLVPSGRRSGYPDWMRGPLAGHSAALPLHSFLVLMGLMVAAWLVLLVCARRLPLWFVGTATIAAVLPFALAPPLLSTDVFNYIAYGHMGVRGINPYAHGPITLQGTALYGYTGHMWRTVPSAYGPLFTLLTYALAPLSVAAAFWTLKALCALSVIALAGFAAATAKRLGADPRTAVALVALNPLVLVYALGGAHNDLLMAVALAAAAYLAVCGRAATAGAMAVAAVAIKASAGLALPFVLLGARPRKRAFAGAAIAGVVLVASSLLVFGSAIANMPKAIALGTHFHWMVVSVPGFLAHYLGFGTPSVIARHCITALGGAVVVGLIVRARGGSRWPEAAAGAALVVLATTAWVLPWYLVLALPFAALARGRVVPIAVVLLTTLLMAMQLDHFVLQHASHHTKAAAVHHRRHRA